MPKELNRRMFIRDFGRGVLLGACGEAQTAATTTTGAGAALSTIATVGPLTSTTTGHPTTTTRPLDIAPDYPD